MSEPAPLTGITAAHNAARARVDADPALPPLEWSSELAAQAQAWAEHIAAECALEHSGDAYGENIAFFGGSDGTPEEVVAMWESEERCYRFGPFMRGDRCTHACDASGGCGHYTQIAWRGTERVGCGVARCDEERVLWVCKYDPAGNIVGEEPW